MPSKLSLAVVVATACTLVTAAPAAATAAPGASSERHRPIVVTARYRDYQPGARAITYRQDLVPAGSRGTVFSFTARGRTTVVFKVSGLVPHREYGAHVHTKPCGATGNDAGPHFQHVVDPVQPSVDPKYANPANEIWLDLTTDRRGNGLAVSTVDWRFTDRRAGSVVIHETHTHTDPGHAGTAGARLACLSVPF